MEITVVVAIIMILSMIVLPNIMKFFAKAKRTEAYVYLNALYAAEKAYWAEHGSYTTQLSGAKSIGWKPEGYKGGGSQERFYYTYGFPGSEGISHFTGNLETSASYLSRAQAGKNKFLALAVADIDGDGKADILAVDETGAITILEDDLAD